MHVVCIEKEFCNSCYTENLYISVTVTKLCNRILRIDLSKALFEFKERSNISNCFISAHTRDICSPLDTMSSLCHIISEIEILNGNI